MSKPKIKLKITNEEKEKKLKNKKDIILNNINFQKSIIYNNNKSYSLYNTDFEKYIIDGNETESNSDSVIDKKNLKEIRDELGKIKNIQEMRTDKLLKNKNIFNINNFIIKSKENQINKIQTSNIKENKLINLYNADEDYYNYYFYDDKSFLHNNINKSRNRNRNRVIQTFATKSSFNTNKTVKINTKIDIIEYNKEKRMNSFNGNNLNKIYKKKSILKNKSGSIRLNKIPKLINLKNNIDKVGSNNININISRFYLFSKTIKNLKKK